MMDGLTYLDHNATTPVHPWVIEAVGATLDQCGNASSVHGWGRRAHAALEKARDAVASLAGARSDGLVFTSGGTEANNLALMSFKEFKVAVSAIEHDSVLHVRNDAQLIPVDPDGVIDLNALEQMIDGRTLVSVMVANNETGVIQPIDKIGVICREKGAMLHCDAVQAAGKIALDLASNGVHLASLSAHKIGGPQGVGALVVYNPEIQANALLVGGGQEKGMRPGTENLPGIVGFGVAASIARDELCNYVSMAALRDRLEAQIKRLSPDSRIFGQRANRLPNTSCFTMPGVGSEAQVMSLDLAGVMVSAGSACSSGKVKSSHVLRAMGVEQDIAGTAIRISFGRGNAEADVDKLMNAWGRLFARHGFSEQTAAAAKSANAA